MNDSNIPTLKLDFEPAAPAPQEGPAQQAAPAPQAASAPQEAPVPQTAAAAQEAPAAPKGDPALSLQALSDAEKKADRQMQSRMPIAER